MKVMKKLKGFFSDTSGFNPEDLPTPGSIVGLSFVQLISPSTASPPSRAWQRNNTLPCARGGQREG
jgi:hypothetical protein